MKHGEVRNDGAIWDDLKLFFVPHPLARKRESTKRDGS